jgi:hypothetical protein
MVPSELCHKQCLLLLHGCRGHHPHHRWAHDGSCAAPSGPLPGPAPPGLLSTAACSGQQCQRQRRRQPRGEQQQPCSGCACGGTSQGLRRHFGWGALLRSNCSTEKRGGGGKELAPSFAVSGGTGGTGTGASFISWRAGIRWRLLEHWITAMVEFLACRGSDGCS